MRLLMRRLTYQVRLLEADLRATDASLLEHSIRRMEQEEILSPMHSKVKVNTHISQGQVQS